MRYGGRQKIYGMDLYAFFTVAFDTVQESTEILNFRRLACSHCIIKAGVIAEIEVFSFEFQPSAVSARAGVIIYSAETAGI